MNSNIKTSITSYWLFYFFFISSTVIITDEKKRSWNHCHHLQSLIATKSHIFRASSHKHLAPLSTSEGKTSANFCKFASKFSSFSSCQVSMLHLCQCLCTSNDYHSRRQMESVFASPSPFHQPTTVIDCMYDLFNTHRFYYCNNSITIISQGLCCAVWWMEVVRGRWSLGDFLVVWNFMGIYWELLWR